jgi:hypothetical protein
LDAIPILIKEASSDCIKNILATCLKYITAVLCRQKVEYTG